MILKNLNFIEIRHDALNAISRGSSRILFVFYYYGIPLLISFLLVIFDYFLDKDVVGNIISGISLLSGLMFSLLVVVTNNYSKRKGRLTSNNDESVRYLNNYKQFANELIAVISYSVVKSLIIIVALVFVNSYLEYLDDKMNCFLKYSWIFVYTFMIQYIIFILFIVNNMYAMLYDDINSNH